MTKHVSQTKLQDSICSHLLPIRSSHFSVVEICLHSQTQALSEYDTVSSDVFISKFRGLTLPEYCAVRGHYCRENHNRIHCREDIGI